jgi:oligopeptide transport system ATP-binding protein
LKIRDLSISFQTASGRVDAVRHLNLDLYRGETLAIVGESGCGKSVTAKIIIGISSSNQSIDCGSAIFNYKDKNAENVSVDLVKLSSKQMSEQIKGKRIAMIFQDPMTSLDPTMTIGRQIIEGMCWHYKTPQKEAWDRAIELLRFVGIEDADKRMKNYPHQLSGGMRQRVVIAAALSCEPEILICDEPTTALDVTIQARILQLIVDIQKKTGIAIIFITHDMGVVAKMADYVNVMYAGKIIESGSVDDIFYDPRHPYTWGLLSSIPDIDTLEKRLYAIPGNPPNLLNKITGDAFAVRNPFALNIDFKEEPPMFRINNGHCASTWLLHPDAPKTDMPSSLRCKIDSMVRNE